MKTQRRHELKTNVLADWLDKQIEAIKPHWQIIVGVILGAAALVVLIVYMSGEPQPSGDAWTAYFDAVKRPNSEEALQKVVANNQGSPAAWWAKLASADLHLESGLRTLYTDRGQAVKELKRALDGYEDVAQKSNDAILTRRATFGLAKTYESLAATRENNDDLRKNQAKDLKKAGEYYLKVAKDDPEGTLGKQAQHCYDRMIDKKGNLNPSIVALYEHIVSYEPPPNQFGPTVYTEANLPDVPDLTFPGEEEIVEEPSGDGEPKNGEPKDGEPKDGEPKKGEPKDGEPKDGEPIDDTSKGDDDSPSTKSDDSVDSAPKPSDDAPADDN